MCVFWGGMCSGLIMLLCRLRIIKVISELADYPGPWHEPGSLLLVFRPLFVFSTPCQLLLPVPVPGGLVLGHLTKAGSEIPGSRTVKTEKHHHDFHNFSNNLFKLYNIKLIHFHLKANRWQCDDVFNPREFVYSFHQRSTFWHFVGAAAEFCRALARLYLTAKLRGTSIINVSFVTFTLRYIRASTVVAYILYIITIAWLTNSL